MQMIRHKQFKKSAQVGNLSTIVAYSGKRWELIFYFYRSRSDKMNSLLGVYECNIDAKGRLLLPSAFKKQLQALLDKGFVVKRSVFHKCLELYSIDEWTVLVKDINKLNRFKKKNADFIRMFNAGVKSVELDGSGRILLPKDLVTFA